MKDRIPYVAGYFYPADERELISLISKFIIKTDEKISAIGCVVPHAGYIYSGKVAGKVYSSIKIPNNVIILGPNHNGLGAPASIYKEGKWLTPLGKVDINNDLSEKILKHSKYLIEDLYAHRYEHSIEVQIPFLQFLNPNISIVPITIVDYRTPILYDLAIAIYKAILETNDPILVIASSDFSHYEPLTIAKEKDFYAIEAILNLDEEEFMNRVREEDISICGSGPIFVTITVSKYLGASKGVLIDYSTSGDITKDYSEVVGYAGIVFLKESG
uniref:MEMO1 family protein ENW00_04645 n=1 Tax=Dictyoglomus thermophilum TaxID=14 RepID=A0A7C3RM90_DICTH